MLVKPQESNIHYQSMFKQPGFQMMPNQLNPPQLFNNQP